MKDMLDLPVAVIGAGPIGLAAAAHLAARNQAYIVLERGSRPAAAMHEWQHVTIFSPWRYNVDRAAQALLEESGWRLPPGLFDRDPTGRELIETYLEPLARLPAIASFVRYDACVTAVTRRDMDLLPNDGRIERPFELVVRNSAGAEHRIIARAVIDASGTWHTPNPAGASGVPAEGERALNGRICYGIPDVYGNERERFAGSRVMVIGAGHSSMDVVLDLARLKQEVPDTEILWTMRKPPTDKTFGGAAADQLATRGALGTRARGLIDQGEVRLIAPFRTRRLSADGNQIVVTGEGNGSERSETVDEVIVATGFRPDFSMLSELRLELDPAVQAPRVLSPLIDPNFHSCGDVPPHGHRELAHPERDFFMVGMKSYGRAPTFLMATGYEQVRSVVAQLSGDQAAADDVRLVLPQTGVCEGLGHGEAAAAGCCGGPAVASKDACCVVDEAAKKAGADCCGCAASTLPSPACC